MTTRLKVVSVGAGWVTCNRHLPSLKAHPEVAVLGVVAQPDALNRLSGTQLRKLGVERTAAQLD